MYVYILFLDFPIYFTVAEGIYYQDHLNMSGQLCERQQPPPPRAKQLPGCILAYALSKLDFLHCAVPPNAGACVRIQRIVNRIVRQHLRLPASSPTTWLYASTELGGLGVPVVLERARLLLLRGFFDALNSRNGLIRRNLRFMWQHHQDLPHAPADASALVAILQSHKGCLSLPPHPQLAPVVPDITILRTWTGAPVLLISDGSYAPGCLGWAAAVADSHGLLAHAAAAVPCAGGHSTAAEWLGRAQAVSLARSMDIPHRTVCQLKYWTGFIYLYVSALPDGYPTQVGISTR